MANNNGDAPSSRVATHARSRGFLVFLIAFAAHVFVTWNYLDAPFIVDDLYYLRDLGLIETGQAHWTDFWLAPHSGYLHAFWRLEFNALWRLFGADPSAWRLSLGVIHAFTAVLVFHLLRIHGIGPVAAWSASLLWGGAAIGMPENPFLHLMSGEQTVSLFWVLLGMWFVARKDSLGSILALPGMAACVFISLMTWGVAASFAPVILVQWILLDAGSSRSRAERAGWSLVFLFAWFGTLLLHLLILGTQILQGWGTSSLAPGFSSAVSGVMLFLASLENLMPWAAFVAGCHWLLALPILVFVAVRCRKLDATTRKVVAVFLAIALGFVAAVVLFRSGGEMQQGRYLYLPTLFWCVAIGCIIDAPTRGTSPPPPARRIRMAGAMLIFLVGQRTLATSARMDCDRHFAVTSTAIDDYVNLFRELARRPPNGPVVIPDAPLLLPPHMAGYFSVSAFVCVFKPEGNESLVIVPADRFLDEHADSLASILGTSNNPAAISLTASIEQVVPDLRLLSDLESKLRENHQLLRLGRTTLGYPALGLELDMHEAFARGLHRLPESLDFTGESSPDGWRELLSTLEPLKTERSEIWSQGILASLRLASEPGSAAVSPLVSNGWQSPALWEGNGFDYRFVANFETPEAYSPARAVFPKLQQMDRRLARHLAGILWPQSSSVVGRFPSPPSTYSRAEDPSSDDMERAIAKLEEGDPAAAETWFLRAGKQGGPDADWNGRPWAARLALAVIAMERGELSRASDILVASAQGETPWPEFDYLLGLAHAQQGSRDQARASFSRAIGSFPEHAGAHHALGVLHWQSGNKTAARSAFVRAATLLPLDPQLRNAIADLQRVP